jgi:rhodanese-related sulfurtransferase
MSDGHDPDFDALCDAARAVVREVSIDEVKARLDRQERFFFIDIREDREWAEGRLPEAMHLGRGILERDLKKRLAEHGAGKDADLVLYCGGGYRSVLSAESLQKMGYRRVASMAGGYRGWKAKGFPVVTP